MIYCYKGLIGQIAPIIVHCSMVLILFGTIISSLFSFKAQELFPKSETFHIQNILNSGPFTIIPKRSTRINDFWITYTNTKTISQFYSDISILNSKGIEMYRKTISVNSPFINRAIYYYQTDWELLGLRLQNEHKQIMEYPLVNVFKNQNKVWLTWILQVKNGKLIVIDNLEGYCSIYNDTTQFLGNLELNELITFDDSLTLIDIISCTGLQIKTDPGLSIIYLGFFCLMISVLISYITYSQIWLIKKNQKLFIGGNTSRAVFDFELEFFSFLR